MSTSISNTMKKIFVIISVFLSSQCLAQNVPKPEESVLENSKPMKKNGEPLFIIKKADTSYYWSRTREIGMDFTGLISQFVPFNLNKAAPAMIGLRAKFYDVKTAFRINFGLSNIDNTEGRFYISVGYEKRKPVYKKIFYTGGWDGVIKVEPNDNPNFNNGIGSRLLIGPARHYGLEYHFSEKFFIATEAFLNLLIGTGADIGFTPPTNLYLHVRL